MGGDCAVLSCPTNPWNVIIVKLDNQITETVHKFYLSSHFMSNIWSGWFVSRLLKYITSGYTGGWPTHLIHFTERKVGGQVAPPTEEWVGHKQDCVFVLIDVDIYEGENLIFYLIWEDYPSRSVNRKSPIILRLLCDLPTKATHNHYARQPLQDVPCQIERMVNKILARKVVGRLLCPRHRLGWEATWFHLNRFAYVHLPT